MIKKITEIINRKMVLGKFFFTIVELVRKSIIKLLRFILRLIILLFNKIFRVIRKILCYPDRIIAIWARRVMAKNTPIENKIMFLAFQGDYTCNPKGIANEIIKQGLEYPLVWAVKSGIPRSDYPLELDFVKYNTYTYYKQLASSKIIIENTNILERLGFYKKPGQYIFQTWHGSLGIKRLDGDVVMGMRWKRIARNCQKDVDFCLSNSSFETEVFESSYWKGVPNLLTGHARNDVFFLKDEKEIQKIREKVYKFLGIEQERKIFLFAPTHRDNVSESYEGLDYEKIKEALEKRFGGEWQIVIRLHNRLKRRSKRWLKNQPSYVSNATFYEDMQELLLCTDVGVTDYSSWIFDYVLSGKPGFIVKLGIEEFENQRGFYYPIETTPFPIADDHIELVEKILAFDEEQYKKDVAKFLEARGCMEDGHASERIVAKIKELMEES